MGKRFISNLKVFSYDAVVTMISLMMMIATRLRICILDSCIYFQLITRMCLEHLRRERFLFKNQFCVIMHDRQHLHHSVAVTFRVEFEMGSSFLLYAMITVIFVVTVLAF
jgi:hypothetical protein